MAHKITEQETQSKTVSGILTEIRYLSHLDGWGVFRAVTPEGLSFECSGKLIKPVLFESLKLIGEWVTSPSHLPEIAFNSVITSPPKDVTYLPRYLTEVINTPPKTANLIVGKFGTHSINILDTDCSKLLQAGITNEDCISIGHAWSKARGLNELLSQLDVKGVPAAALVGLKDKFGDDADLNSLIRKDPYILYRSSDEMTFSTAKTVAQYYKCSTSSDSAIKGAVVAFLRASYKIKGIKHQPEEAVLSGINSPNFLNGAISDSSSVKRCIDFMLGDEIEQIGKYIQLKGVYDTQEKLSTKVKSLISSTEVISDELKVIGIHSRLTTMSFPLASIMDSWLGLVETCATKFGFNVIVLTPTIQSGSKGDAQFPGLAFSDYASFLDVTSSTSSVYNETNPLEADLLVVIDSHLISDDALQLILSAAHNDCPIVLQGSAGPIQAPSFNSSINAIIEAHPSGKVNPAPPNHWAYEKTLPFTEGELDFSLPISWINCADNDLVQSVDEIRNIFNEDMGIALKDIQLITVSPTSSTTKIQSDLKTTINRRSTSVNGSVKLPNAEVPIGSNVLATMSLYDIYTPEFTVQTLIGMNSDVLTLETTGIEHMLPLAQSAGLVSATCLPMDFAHKVKSEITILICHSEHVQFLNKQTLLSMKNTASKHLVVIGATRDAASQWAVMATKSKPSLSFHMEKKC